MDNNSKDGTSEFIKSNFPQVKLQLNTYNAGFSVANNQGFEKSTGEYVLLLNPDAKLTDGNFQKAMNYLQSHPRSLLGPKLINPDGTLQESVIETSTAFSILAEACFLGYFLKQSQESILRKGNFGLSGACLLMKRELFSDLKGLDPELFWMEDIDFCKRARSIGYETVYFRDWVVMHHVGQSSKTNFKVSISNQLISKYKFLKKQKKHLSVFFSAVFIELHLISRLLLFLLLSPFKAEFRSKLFAYFYTNILFIKFILTSKKQTF